MELLISIRKKSVTTIKSIWILYFLFPALLASWGQHPEVFTDQATFIVYKDEERIGLIQNSLDSNGNYFREFQVSLAGQTARYTMEGKSLFSKNSQIKWSNAVSGDAELILEGTQATYKFQDKTATDNLPSGYILYDDYGSLFESIMFRNYDKLNGGPQVFRRYRISEGSDLQNTNIDVTINYLGDEELVNNDQVYLLQKFDWEVFGIHATYWVDEEFKIYKSVSTFDNSAIVRKGFEDFLDFDAKAKN